MNFYIPKHIKGRLVTKADEDAGRPGVAYDFFRGIHHVPDAIADSHEANALGIVPVEEMTDEQWRLLGLDKDRWMEEHRPTPKGNPVEAEDLSEGGKPADETEAPHSEPVSHA